MTTAKKRAHKHFQLDSVKIKRAQQVFHAKTETEAIERALDLAITEHLRNEAAIAAHDRLGSSGIQIEDVYGVLED